MKNLAWIIPAAALAVMGCHKHAESPATQTPPANGDAAAATPATPEAPGPNVEPATPPPPAVAANADNFVRENVTGEANPFLTSQLRVFIQQYNRLPKSFAEFALRRIDSMPPAPEGKKWVIDSATQEVKAVAK